MNKQDELMFSGKTIANIIVPLVLQNILTITIGMVDSIMVSSRGESAYAGVSLVSSLDTLLITLFSSLASGGSVVLAQSMGCGNRKNTCDSAKQLLYVTTTVAVLISAVVLIFRQPILHILFGKAEASVMSNALSYFTMIVSVVSMWVFRVALAYILAKDTVSFFGLFRLDGANLGVMGVWVAMTADWVVRTAIFLWRFLSGKWLSKHQPAKQ